jgi:hypothetical protein
MAEKKGTTLISTAQSRANRVALYCRVSTNTGQQNPEMQLREVREYAERRGWSSRSTRIMEFRAPKSPGRL